MRHRQQTGFALLAAIFILVILGMVSAFVVNISGMTHRTSVYAVEGARAIFAARSGLEWGVKQIVDMPTACPTATTLSLTQGGASGFSVSVSCTASSFTEGTATFNVFVLTSIAERGSFGSTDYVSRQMQVTVTLGA